MTFDKRNPPKTNVDARRPDEWASISWDEDLSCFKVAMTTPAAPPRVGHERREFLLEVSQALELRDALSLAIQAAGAEG